MQQPAEAGMVFTQHGITMRGRSCVILAFAAIQNEAEEFRGMALHRSEQ